MQNSGYYRMRADMCLRIANCISDGESAKKLRADAAHYFARAEEIDARDGQNSTSAPGGCDDEPDEPGASAQLYPPPLSAAAPPRLPRRRP